MEEWEAGTGQSLEPHGLSFSVAHNNEQVDPSSKWMYACE